MQKRSFCLKRQTVFKILFLSLILSSCGLIEKFKTPEQPTDSKSEASNADKPAETNPDDLFTKSLNEADAKNQQHSDAPSNISSNNETKALENEFNGNTPQESVIKESKNVKVEESLPDIKTDIATQSLDNANGDAGKIMSYKVQKGETLMQIAFKIYGDISKWKELKVINGAKFSKNTALRANMELKYKAPEKTFVWNPEGTPYLIKTGETLGTISNSVYQTPKKWKRIWENNKPLITNPNVIYAGFTLYYKGSEMANYVQPNATQKKLASKSLKNQDKNIEVDTKSPEEINVDQAISKLESTNTPDTSEIDLTSDVQSAINREVSTPEAQTSEATDEALTK